MHTVLFSLLGALLVSSTASGAPILKGSSTGDQSSFARRETTHELPFEARFGMPVAAAHGGNAIHPGTDVIPRSQDLVGRVLPLIAPINLPGRVGLAGGGSINPRNDDDAIGVVRRVTRYDVLGV